VFRDDYLMRQIEQLAGFLARAAGFSAGGAPAEALRELREAWDQLFGDVPRELVDVLDLPTLTGLLRTPERVKAAAQLLAEEARALELLGDPRAATVQRRARELAALG
jgi:hypothetical protein